MLRNGPIHVPQLCELCTLHYIRGVGERPAKLAFHLFIFYPFTLLPFYAFTLLRFYPFTLLLFYAFTLLRLYAFTLLPFYAFALLSFYPFTLLRFYAFTLLRFYAFTFLRFYAFTLLPLYPCTLLRFYSFTLLRFYRARLCLGNTVSKDTPGATTGPYFSLFSQGIIQREAKVLSSRRLWPLQIGFCPKFAIEECRHLGVSKNRGTPKWMVYNGNPYKNG